MTFNQSITQAIARSMQDYVRFLCQSLCSSTWLMSYCLEGTLLGPVEAKGQVWHSSSTRDISPPHDFLLCKSRKSLFCKTKREIKICERYFLCKFVVFCPKCQKCPQCCSKSGFRSQTESVLGNLGLPRGQPQGHKNPQGSYTLPF